MRSAHGQKNCLFRAIDNRLKGLRKDSGGIGDGCRSISKFTSPWPRFAPPDNNDQAKTVGPFVCCVCCCFPPDRHGLTLHEGAVRGDQGGRAVIGVPWQRPKGCALTDLHPNSAPFNVKLDGASQEGGQLFKHYRQQAMVIRKPRKNLRGPHKALRRPAERCPEAFKTCSNLKETTNQQTNNFAQPP